MKLYYDMLVPYMPDAIRNESGELIPDTKRAAGRNAMIELSKYQMTGDIDCLYQSIIYACIYTGDDLVDIILGIPEEIVIQDGVSVSQLIDDSAKMLFSSIKPMHDLDIYTFVCNILNAAHALSEVIAGKAMQDASQTTESTEDSKSSEN